MTQTAAFVRALKRFPGIALRHATSIVPVRETFPATGPDVGPSGAEASPREHLSEERALTGARAGHMVRAVSGLCRF